LVKRCDYHILGYEVSVVCRYLG